MTGPPAVLAPAVQQLQDAHAAEHGRQDGPHDQNIRGSLVPVIHMSVLHVLSAGV
jgi:hypothetical protein